MADKYNKKSQIQSEIERLSWELEVEKEKLQKEYEEPLTDAFEEDDDIEIDKLYAKDDELGRWMENKSYDYDINQMGRDLGIVFDEEKLEKAKIRDWHKPPKLRYAWYDRCYVFIKRGLVSLARAVLNGVYVLFKNAGRFVKLFFALLKVILVYFWEFIMAFKHVYVYLFGSRGDHAEIEQDIDWPVEKNQIRFYGMSTVLKKSLSFVLVASLLILPFYSLSKYRQIDQVKGEVMGASKMGLDYLKQGGEAGMKLDFNAAQDNFELAQSKLSYAEVSLSNLGLIANQVGNFFPEFKQGKELIQMSRLTAEVGAHLSTAADGLDRFFKQANFELAANESSADNIEYGQDVKWGSIVNELDLAANKTVQIINLMSDLDIKKSNLGEYAPILESYRQNLPLLENYLVESRNLFELAGYFIGAEEPRRLMLVFQNNREIRPTGGFMGSYAIVDIKNGEIKQVEVPGGGFYDLKGSLEARVDAPHPFHLFSPVWQPWNANWFPDWKVSSEKIMWFYDKSGGPTVDGIITFTPDVMEEILNLVGEIDMPQYNTAVNSKNFVRMTQIEVELEYDKQENKPKQFIADLMPKVLNRLNELDSEKAMELVLRLSDLLENKQILLYSQDDKIQHKIEQFSWAGRIQQTDGDYLQIVNTNVAGGKTDKVVERGVKHNLQMLSNGKFVVELKINTIHNGKPDDVFEGHKNTNYMRIYVPLGSQLITAQGFDEMPIDRDYKVDMAVSPDPSLKKYEKLIQVDDKQNVRIKQEFDKYVYAGWVSVEPGEEKQVSLKYILPFGLSQGNKLDVIERDYNFYDLVIKYFVDKYHKLGSIAQDDRNNVYSLYIQKQPGSSDVKFVSQIKPAPGWQIFDYVPNSEVEIIEGGGLKYETQLDSDKVFGFKTKNN